MSEVEAFIRAVLPAAEGLGEEFIAYMQGLFPQPRTLWVYKMCDVSPASVDLRKKKFTGHIAGYDPALVWHLKDFVTKRAAKP